MSVNYRCTTCGFLWHGSDTETRPCPMCEQERLTAELAATRALLEKAEEAAGKWKRLIEVFGDLPTDTEIVLRKRDVDREAKRLVDEAAAAVEKVPQ